MKILIVEDDPVYRGVLVVHAEAQGHEVVAVAGAFEGIRAFNTRYGTPQAFDLVLTDFELPDAKGIYVFWCVAGKLGTCQFVLMTGQKNIRVLKSYGPRYRIRVYAKTELADPDFEQLRGELRVA